MSDHEGDGQAELLPQLDPDVRRRMLVGSCAALGVVAVLIALVGVLTMPRSLALWELVFLCLTGGGSVVAILLALRLSGSVTVAGRLFVGLMVTVVTAGAYFDGGFDAGTISWMMTTPLLAAFLIGPGAAMTTGGVVVSLIFCFELARVAGVAFPPAQGLAGGSAMRVVLHSSPIVLVTLFARDYEHTRRLSAARLRATNNALVRARDEALEGDRAKTRFLATMSHEIRTPLNAVLGVARLLKESPLSEPQAELVQTLQKGGQNLLQLVEGILDFSRLDAGMLETELGDLLVHESVEEVLELFSPAAWSKGVALRGQVWPGATTGVRGDAVRVRQVLTNLVSNALKFTPSGEILVDVRAVESPEDVIRLRFEVSDTGVGISEEAQPSIFQHFTQEDASTTRQYGGSGLGLAITEKLVGLMGGTLGFHSEKDVGSTFWVELPFAPRSTTFGPVMEADAPLGGTQVLLAEPDPRRACYLADLLGSLGAAVIPVSSPVEASAARVALESPSALLLLSWELSEPMRWALLGWATGCGVKVVGLSTLGPADEVLADVQHLDTALSWPLTRRCLSRTLAGSKDGCSPSGVVGRRVLVVDDNAPIRRVLVRMLQHLGLEADSVDSAVAALRAMSQRDYGLLLLDCHMPQHDGLELVAEIRFREQLRRRTPLVAVTADVRKSFRLHCLASGVDGFLSKPVALDALSEELGRWSLGPADGSDHALGPTRGSGGMVGSILERQDEASGALAQELVQMAKEDIAVTLRSLQEALELGAAEDVLQKAHYLKSTCALLGARDALRVCAELGVVARRGDLTDGPVLIERLGLEFHQAIEALERS